MDTTVKKNFKEKLDDWKGAIEHLNLQLHLGAAEAGEEFEKQKTRLRKWLDEAIEKVKDTPELSQEKASEIRGTLESLRVQVALGKAETSDNLRKQQVKISDQLNELQYKMKKALDTPTEKVSTFTGQAHDTLEQFKTRFDMFKLRAKLAEMEASDTWDDKKKELSNMLSDLNDKIEKGKDMSAERWENFSEEMSEAWDHFKSALKPEQKET